MTTPLEELHKAAYGSNGLAESVEGQFKEDEVQRITKSVGSYPVLRGNDGSKELSPFPLEVLPPSIRQFVTEASQAFPCPPDFLAVPLLVILGAAIGRSRVLEVKPGWQESSRLWAAIVAPPGEIKTPALELASRWARKRQEDLWEAFREAQEKHQRDALDFEVRLTQWKQKKIKNQLLPEEVNESV